MTFLRELAVPAIAVIVGVSAGRVAKADYDVRPYTAANGRLDVGGVDDANEASYQRDASGNTFFTSLGTPPVAGDPPPPLVYGFGFGDDADQPFFTTDPGFNSIAGALPASKSLLFRILPSGTGPSGPQYLRYWDGTGSPSFGGPASGESLQLKLSSHDITIGAGSLTGTDAATSGFKIQTTAANGSAHTHLESHLFGSDGNDIPADPYGSDPFNLSPGDGVEAAAGIYLIKMQLYMTGTGSLLGDSDPFWVVYNNGLSDETHDAAINYVATTLVPEPSGLAAAGITLVAMLRRRRRR